MVRLFISYTREDGTQFSDRLKDDVLPNVAWLDRSENVGGVEWALAIEKAIDESRGVLAVLTNAYHNSKYARDELARAIRTKTPIIPLRFHPGVDPTLYLETAHYIDFIDPATHDKNLTELFRAIEKLPERGAVPAAAPAGVAPDLTWESVVSRSGKQTRRFVGEHAGNAKTPGTFIADVYVQRDAAERELDRFLEGSANTLILLGDSGVGKTNLLCRFALDLVDKGHGVLAYDCSALADTDVESEISRDLGIPQRDGLDAALESIDAEAARASRQVVLLFDSVGDFRGSENNGVQVLLRRINALAGRVGGHTRIVMSWNAAMWKRMERLTPMRLDSERYFRSSDDEPFVRLESFTVSEFEAAYPQYQKFFDLSCELDALSDAVRDRLREPVLLRITAEAYRGVERALFPVNLGLGVYRRFFEDRVRLPREVWLVDKLAEQMLTRQTSSLAVTELANDNELGPEILSEDPTSTYSRLLDRSVLQELRGDLRTGIMIKFSHSRVAAYALARNALKRSKDVAETARSLVAAGAQFALAWDVAKTMLLVSVDQTAFLALAESRDIEHRELVAEALVELYADDPKTASQLLQRLLDEKSEEARRTALKAAYNIGPQTRDLFLRAAIDGDPALRDSLKNTLYLIWRNESPAGRRSVTDTLYLIWRTAPGFTHELLNSLLGEIGLMNIAKLPAILEFVLDLSITIYINHCEEQQVIEQTAAVLRDLAIERLHLNLINTGILGPGFEKLVFRAVSGVFSRQILNWMLFGDVAPIETFFELPKERRASLARIADVLDPASDLATAHDDLAAMLQSRMPIFSGSATLAIAVHASKDLASVEPVVRRLWAEVDADGRLWILAGFSVLIKNTPTEWVRFLEDLTNRYIEEHRSVFLSEASRLPGNLDVVLAPLGLAYGKQGTSMPLFETLLKKGMAAGDTALVARCIQGLGAVGFYYPYAMLEVIRPAMENLADSEVQNALVSTLATVRTLHFDAVDQFLNRANAPDDFRHRIYTATDVGLVHLYIHVLGYYNNAVHLSLYYPKMRRGMSAGALKMLADAKNADEFIANYTMTATRMWRESGYEVLEWTRPD